jgi:hypothetical protein
MPDSLRKSGARVSEDDPGLDTSFPLSFAKMSLRAYFQPYG